MRKYFLRTSLCNFNYPVFGQLIGLNSTDTMLSYYDPATKSAGVAQAGEYREDKDWTPSK